ncbi:DUF3850 domain-containing protein [Streptococcus canis]|uniref:DUF3850 domain-containing protein n=1 Tax=Streptococcus canis TaxID=1329 RepID=A0AAE4Q4J1_STRCB|nr:DUF3850 domain-containing protein [Streptococcus canis]MDV5976236.1 DUF3850 domain-containing protein [Streptococcus canis]MDV6023363.1 DUF3850 domain-containing protein [Streptococcus canis]HES2369692.1 DUF3850 domain-containing protein [Streptococcus pyogenes]
MKHYLKLHPKYFDDVKSEKKNFEVRFNDRDFKVGDILNLNEYYNGYYTGRFVERRVTYVLNDFIGLTTGFVALGLESVEE